MPPHLCTDSMVHFLYTTGSFFTLVETLTFDLTLTGPTLTSPHSSCPIKAWLTDLSVSPLDQSNVPVSSQQEDVSIPPLSWQEVSLLKGLLGNVFLLPIFSSFPPLTNSDELLINMAATLPNRPFFVNLPSHVSETSSRLCHSSRPLRLKLPTLDRWAVQPHTAGACQPHVSFFTCSHLSPGWVNQDLPVCGKNHLCSWRDTRQACFHVVYMQSPGTLHWNMNHRVVPSRSGSRSVHSIFFSRFLCEMFTFCGEGIGLSWIAVITAMDSKKIWTSTSTVTAMRWNL